MKLSASSPYSSLCLLLVSMISIQCSASLAKTIFPLVGPEGTTALRLMVSAVILLVVVRPWRRKITRQAWKPIVLYGLSTGCMNMCFYQAISRIPLGVAVGLEFTGPMAVALLSSRRITDFLWIILAAAGLYLLLPLRAANDIDPAGALFALCAGCCWGLYIVFGKKAGNSGDSAASVAQGMLVGACFIFPFGIFSAGVAMFAPSVLPLAVVLGIFSSALPTLWKPCAQKPACPDFRHSHEHGTGPCRPVRPYLPARGAHPRPMAGACLHHRRLPRRDADFPRQALMSIKPTKRP